MVLLRNVALFAVNVRSRDSKTQLPCFSRPYSGFLSNRSLNRSKYWTKNIWETFEKRRIRTKIKHSLFLKNENNQEQKMYKTIHVIVQLMCKSYVFDWPFQHRIDFLTCEKNSWKTWKIVFYYHVISYLQLTFAPMENNSDLFHNWKVKKWLILHYFFYVDIIRYI